jgi:hypothetical protein
MAADTDAKLEISHRLHELKASLDSLNSLIWFVPAERIVSFASHVAELQRRVAALIYAARECAREPGIRRGATFAGCDGNSTRDRGRGRDVAHGGRTDV